MNHKQEILAQGEALAEIGGNTNALIDAYAGLMRDIINEFYAAENRLPDGHEIVWCLGIKIGRDPKEVK